MICLDITHEVDFIVVFAGLYRVVLHSRGATDISIDENSGFFHGPIKDIIDRGGFY